MAYGIRMLVDMAERSIAEGPLVDPTTTTQAIDRIYDCLRQLAPRPFPAGERRDASGDVRLRFPTCSWDDYVHLAFDELVLGGRGSPAVQQRLLDVLDDLDRVAPRDRRRVLHDVRRRIDPGDELADGRSDLDAPIDLRAAGREPADAPPRRS